MKWLKINWFRKNNELKSENDKLKHQIMLMQVHIREQDKRIQRLEKSLNTAMMMLDECGKMKRY